MRYNSRANPAEPKGPAMDVYPYSFVPIYKEKIWGGRSLERLFGRDLPAGRKIGESWELADLNEGESVVADGPDAGRSLNDLLVEKAPAILGPARPLENGRFPLLLKFLDANDTLSLQVHPDVEAAAEMGPPATPKTECWYILESRGGYILKDAREGVTADRFRDALADETGKAVGELTRRVDVATGEFYFLPAGTLHALGAGVVVAEIQTPSDTTYRVSDWGRGREVHLEQAMRCIHFRPPAPVPGADGDVLVRTPYFAVRQLAAPPGDHPLPTGRCAAWMVLGGRGRIECAGAPAAAEPGRTLLLPAKLDEAVLVVDEEINYLEVTIPA